MAATNDATTTTTANEKIATETTALRAALECRVIDQRFCLNTVASVPLNVTCYGSSSSKTPELYLEEARLMGYILARRGHMCINGAGSYGCMAAMNDGVHAGEGHVRGVIHEMFLADNGYFDVDAKTQKRLMRRGNSHEVFENAVILNREEQRAQQQQQQKTQPRSHGTKIAPIREILVAGGPDLQERKKFLVANTDALIVLPGGPGTWDELWEMACARHLNLNNLPIVCVNVDGYYEPFREMLHRAYVDKLIHLPPDQIVRFASGAEDAVRFVEDYGKQTEQKIPTPEKAKSKENAGVSQRQLLLAYFAGIVSGIAVYAAGTGKGIDISKWRVALK